MPSRRTPPESDAGRVAENRARQRELYGAPLGERVHVLTTVLGITQGRLADVLGLSPAMLSQLASGRRCKIGDPDALARLQALDERCAALEGRPPATAVGALLDEVARVQWRWTPVTTVTARAPAVPAPRPRPAPAPAAGGTSAADALRRIAAPARLAAAAATLGPGFPELAEVLRQAAGRA
ncbi:MAG: XRE family transcriptional regulator [Pseudonocardiales bacterium]|jgi:transcriptional regulator with XRE-family HTH domain|nr:XRE family transcriptional regulator [Pseudonocardiales bacterium]